MRMEQVLQPQRFISSPKPSVSDSVRVGLKNRNISVMLVVCGHIHWTQCMKFKHEEWIPYDFFFTDDGTQQKKCNFTVKNDTNVKTKDNFQPRVFYGTQEECQKYCDIPLCIGYTYSRQDKACVLYMNKASLIPFPQPGIDFYNHTCPTRKLS